GYRAIAFQTHLHAFAGAGRATFHEAPQAEAVIATVDQLSLEMLFFCPTELFKATLEYLAIRATIAFGVGTWVHMSHFGELIWHLRLGDQVFPSDIRLLDAKVSGGKIQKSFHEEAGFKAAGATIRSGRRFVRHEHIGVQGDIGDVIGAGTELRYVARRGEAVRPDIGADIHVDIAAQPDHRSV